VLFMGALVSALLSSADSALLAPASVIGWDLLHLAKPAASEKLSLLVSRLSVLGLGVVALALALHRPTVYDLMVDSWSILLATLFVPLTAGIWWPRANGSGALAAVLVGFTSWRALMILAPDLPADLLAVPVAALALVVVSIATGERVPPNPLRGDDGQPLAFEKRLGV